MTKPNFKSKLNPDKLEGLTEGLLELFDVILSDDKVAIEMKNSLARLRAQVEIILRV